MKRVLVPVKNVRKPPFNVLVSAYACNPFMGSEEGVGWDWVRAISRCAGAVVITAAHHRKDIEKALSEGSPFHYPVTFSYVPHRPWHYRPTAGWRFVERSLLKPAMNIAYQLWLRDAYALACRWCRRMDFRLLHQLTYVGFRFPGYLWKIPKPLVWGPVGGLENTPLSFGTALGVYGWLFFAARNGVNHLQKRFLPGPRRLLGREAIRVIAATSGIRRELRRWYGAESAVICEITAPEIPERPVVQRQADEPLRLSWSGNHEPGKALPLLLCALERLPAGLEWHLDILGDGPSGKAWKRRCEKLGLENGCTWHGRCKREAAMEIVGRSHLFVITSLKDLTSTVLLEALSLGVPVVCPDHCGFTDGVDPSCGIRIKVRHPAQFAADLTRAIKRVAADEPFRRRLAKGCLERVRHYRLEEKAKAICEMYHTWTPGEARRS